jgi:putative acetyltransferase
MEGRAMMAVAHPKLALRPFLPADAPCYARFSGIAPKLTAATTETNGSLGVCGDDVGVSQSFRATALLQRWKAHDQFASLEGKDKIDMLYVHPAATGQGVGAMLVDALEKLAGARGTERLTVDASDSARGFFEKRGYVAQQRNTVSVGDEWLANTTLQKQLATKREAS